MRRRLVPPAELIPLPPVIVLGVPVGLVEAARVRSDSTARLEREADAVASAIDDRVEAGQPLSARALARYVPASHRVLIATRTGHRVSVGVPIAGEVERVRSGSTQSA